MYDSRIGRWTSTDPYGQYYSPYVGMGNDPVNQVDPNGGYASAFGNSLVRRGAFMVGGMMAGVLTARLTGGNMITGGFIGAGAGLGGSFINSSSLSNISNFLQNNGSMLIGGAITKSARLWANETKAYNYMWNNSFRDNKAWREHGAWLTDKGVLVLPNYRNDLETARMDYLPAKGGYVTFKNKKYKILGAIHTHVLKTSDSGDKLSEEDGAAAYFNLNGRPVMTIGYEGVHFGLYKGDKGFEGQFTTSKELLSGDALILPNIKDLVNKFK